MVIDAELLSILRCPETHKKVEPADEATLASLNANVKAGTLKNRQGELVTKSITAALIREDKKCAYIVEDDIPNMLIDERIDL